MTPPDGEQNKDDNGNAIKYLESNKDNILGLVEKHYEILVEVLTNNAIVAASSNPTLSLPSSTSMSSGQYNQNDSYTIEESEIYDVGGGV
ncbi:MAG: hypothetical protein M3156_05970 [Thermoproteota archaeon]|nr:hypothetical protein [Thermoproteota archaeon]